MMKLPTILLFSIVLSSCISVKTAPNIETDEIFEGKKFKKSLGPNNYLIFEDPKDENEFYDFINAKFELNDKDVGQNTKVTIANKDYYFTYYEVEREKKTINAVPILIDAGRDNKGKEPLLEEFHTSRKSGFWYIAIEIYDEALKDALHPNYEHRKVVAEYLRALRKQYVTTSNYEALKLEKKRP